MPVSRAPQVLPQGRAPVFGPVQAAPLQHRHHVAAEILEHAGEDGRPDDEAVAGAGGEVVLELVGDALAGADQQVARLAGGLGEAELLLRHQLQHPVVRAGDALVALGAGDLLGGLVPGEVGADQAGIQHALGLGVDQRLQVGVFLLGDRLGLADHHGEGGQHLAGLRRAAVCRQAGLDVVVEGDGVGLAVRRAEDHLRPARGEFAAALGGAGLQEDRAALRRARDGQRAAAADEAAREVGVADLGGVDEDALLPVQDEGVVVPAVPEGGAGLEHLVAAVVALVLRRDAVHAEVAGLEVGGGGHHVPGGAALGHHVERGQGAGEVVGIHEGGREGGAEAEVPRHAGHLRQDHQRVEVADLAAEPEVGVEIAAVDIGQAEGIGEEAGIEAGGFQDAGDVLVAGGLEDVVEVGFGVAPGAGVVGGRAGLQVGDQVHPALGHACVSVG